MLKGKKFRNAVVSKLVQRAEAADPGDTTAARRLQIQDKSLRDACANGVAVSVVTQDSDDHKRVAACIDVGCREAGKWHTRQNRENRSVQGSSEWVILEVCGGLFQHLGSTVAVLVNASALEEASFTLPNSATEWGEASAQDEGFGYDLLVEDELADIFGQMIWADVTESLMRLLWLVCGWPVSFFQCLNPDDNAAEAETCIDRFARDFRVQVKLRSFKDLVAAEKLLVGRSEFNTRAVKQFVEILDEIDWQTCDEFKRFLIERSRSGVVTQAVEDLNGHEKNNVTLKACRRYRKEATIYAAGLHADVVSGRHQYTSPDDVAPCMVRTAKLEPETYRDEGRVPSLEFEKIRGSSHHSPGPHNVSQRCADNPMLRDLDSRGRLREIPKAYLGECIDVKHRICVCFKEKEDEVETKTFYHGLYHWTASGVLLWPIDVETLGGGTALVMLHKGGQKKPTIKAFTSVAEERCTAYNIIWRSWIWQCRYYQDWARTVTPGVRPFLDLATGEQPIVHLLCYNAFHKLSKSSIVLYGTEVGVDVPAGSDLFDTLWVVDKAVLKKTDAETLALIRPRVTEKVGADTSMALLEMDDFTDLLDRTDVEELHRAQTAICSEIDSRKALEASYNAKARVVHPIPKAKPKPKGKAKAKAAAAAPAFVFCATQPQAKEMLPPGASIWRARVKGGWNAHFPPNPRCSSYFEDFATQDDCLKDLLRRLWREYNRRKAWPLDTCPISDIF